MSVAESTSQQSDVLWRNKRKRSSSNNSSNNDEPSTVDMSLQSPAARAKHAATDQHWASTLQASNSTHLYIQLAAESPARSNEESDDSTYDSFHGLETDECRDTSDTESYDTDGFATLDVIEYEVPSGSSSNSDLYSHDSSSGTDDFVVTAAQLARAIFTQSKAVNRDTSSGSSSPDPFEILADTEESDAPTDPELGRADYWTCVKCKNRQNNPMYRFCERCYQIRKTHFPPRPKLRKCRSSPSNFRSSPSSRGVPPSSASQNGCFLISSDDDNDNDQSTASSRSRHRKRRNSNTRPHKKSKLLDDEKSNSSGESGPGSQSAESEVELGKPGRRESRPQNRPIRNKFLTNVTGAEVAAAHRNLPNRLNIESGSTADSGFQSSTDLSPDAAPPNLAVCSQETYCSELEEGAPLAVTATSSTMSNSSTASSTMTSSLAIRSISSCSTQLSTDSQAARMQRKRSHSDIESTSPVLAKSSLLEESELDLTSTTVVPSTQDVVVPPNADGDGYGMCMMCLTEPKNGVFVHSRFLHLCCCYRCAVKVWNKQKRCPICNCKVKNVMKLFVH